MDLFDWIFGRGSETAKDNGHDKCRYFTEQDFSRVALDMVYPGPKTRDSFWGGTIEECEAAFKECGAIREKYRNLEPRRLRSAVMHWADHFEHRAKEDLADIKSQTRKREMDAYNERSAKEAERVRELTDLIRKGEC